MDDQQNQPLGGQYGIRGFPTIKVGPSLFVTVYLSKKIMRQCTSLPWNFIIIFVVELGLGYC